MNLLAVFVGVELAIVLIEIKKLSCRTECLRKGKTVRETLELIKTMDEKYGVEKQ